MKTEQPILGIDFGTSKTSMAWYNPATGRAEMLHNVEGEEKTPSVVYFGPEILVGQPAEYLLEDEQERGKVVRSVKRDLLAAPSLMIGERLIRPVEVAAHILAKLKRDAETLHFGQQVDRAVITCPAACDALQREQIRNAAVQAGFREVDLLEEPVAAALAYTRSGLEVGQHVLVYDLGAGTFDLACLARTGGDRGFRLSLEPDGLLQCGGDDFDQRLYQHCDQLARRSLGRGLSARPGQLDSRLLSECRRRKENLSLAEEATFSSALLGSDGTPLFFRHCLSRAVFEELIGDLITATVKRTRTVLETAQRQGPSVDTVVLIGGSSRVPLVQRLLREALPVEPRRWQNQDVAVALGAAYHAQTLWGKSVGVENGCASDPLAEEARNLLNEARQARGEKKLDQALGLLQAACELEPHWLAALTEKALVLEERRDFRLAASALTAILRLAPRQTAARVQRGRCLLELGDNAGAWEDFDVAVRDNEDACTVLWRAAAAVKLGRPSDSLADVEEALRQSESQPETISLRPLLHLLAAFLLGELRQSAAGWQACHAALQTLAHTFPLGSVSRERFEQFLDQCSTWCGRFGLPWAKEATAIDAFTATVQRCLWTACQVLADGDLWKAVELFEDVNAGRNVDRTLWAQEPEFALHMGRLAARSGDGARAVQWLAALLTVRPEFDIRRAQQAEEISRCANQELKEFLTPKFSHGRASGWLANNLRVVNLAPFQLTDLVITVSYRHARLGYLSRSLTTALLQSKCAAGWENVFVDPGFLGGNLSQVVVTLTSAQGEARSL